MSQLGHTLGSPVAFPRDRAVRRRYLRERFADFAASILERREARRLLRRLRADTEISRLTGARV